MHDLGVHHSEDGSETLFLTMEFLEGETLAARISRGPIPLTEALPRIEDMLNALMAAHRAGIIHQDFKSNNVMLVQGERRRRAIVTDFGLARPAESRDGKGSLTAVNVLVGAVAYMSPEQIKGEPLTPAADIYALGVVMYEMATGHCPFQGDSDVSIALRHVTEEPIPPSRFIPQFDPNWERVILGCLKKSPQERLASADSVKAALIQQTLPALPHIPIRRSRVLLTVLAGAVILLSIWAAAATHWTWLKSRFSALPAQKRVAVLEFANVGGDPANEAFCEGLMQSFTSKLTRLEQSQSDLSIVPASDVRRSKVTSAGEAHREFNANLVITGSVQRSADGIHLIVNLVNADELKQLRSRAIFVPQNDVVAMEDGVVEQAADLLDVEFGPGTRRQFSQGDTAVPGAYDFYLQGTGYLLQGPRTNEAIAEFEQALKLDPNYALARAGLGEAYWRKYQATKDRGWIGRAWKEAQQAADLNPNLAAVHTTLATLNAGTGHYEEAIRQAQWAVKIDPEDYQAYGQEASALDALNQTQQAEATLKKAIAIRPNYWNSYMRLGTFYFTHGRYKDAAIAYRRVTELVPDNPAGYTDLGAIYHLQGDQAAAESTLKKSLALRPTPEAYSNLATVYFFEGRYADALPIMEQKASAGSKDYMVWGNLADDYRWTPGYQQKAKQTYRTAIALAEDALRANPKDSEALGSMALYEAKLGQIPSALSALEKSLKLAPNDTNLFFKAAVIYDLAGRRDAAINYLGMALRNGYSLNEIAAEPELRKLRGDFRYDALVTATNVNTLRR
jgi:serine/threonine-protein kinase